MLLFFLKFTIHVTDFRCIRSQVLEIWDNLKITDAKPSCLGQHLQLVYEIKQNSCSGWLIFTRASPFPIRDQNACDLCALSFSMEIRMSSVTYLTFIKFPHRGSWVTATFRLAMIKKVGQNMGNYNPQIIKVLNMSPTLSPKILCWHYKQAKPPIGFCFVLFWCEQKNLNTNFWIRHSLAYNHSKGLLYL